MRHLISAGIKTKHKDNLISAVDPHNETILVLVSSIDKEHFVLERDDLLIEVRDVWIGHINQASEYMSTSIILSAYAHLRSVRSHKVHIGVQTSYFEAVSAKIRMRLFPLLSSRVVEHEHSTMTWSHHYMRRVHKVSIPDRCWHTDGPWEEQAEVRSVYKLEPALFSNA